ncbi:MAG: hypothetical protein K2X47_15695 [Bdellovibrionales bacterium]|nr:hypothetical protein [Bdellovibrionales bacterium]
MKLKIYETIAAFFALAGSFLMIPSKGLSQQAEQNPNSIPLKTTDGTRPPSLIDALIERNILKTDQSSMTTVIDGNKLLKDVMNQLSEEVSKQKHPQRGEIQYQILLENIRPGNFLQYHKDGKHLISHDHRI